MRTFDEDVRRRVLAAIERIVNAEAEASRAPKKPEITLLDRYPLVKNDPEATKRAMDAFRSYFRADRVKETQPTTASEDFGSFGTEWQVPSVFWFVGGTDPEIYATAKQSGTIADLPTNHNSLRTSDSSNFGSGSGGNGSSISGVAFAISRLMVNEQIVVNTLLVAFDLGGTFVFALSGATAGVKHRLDLFGVLVLAFAAGNSGGIARDVMIGANPPAAISDWRYLAVSMLAGLITFYWFPIINRLSSPVLVFDAAGLALFAVAGAGKALAFHAGPVAATLLGMLTGIGGGMVRDILVMEIPNVLRTELYAVAALMGAAVMVLGKMLHFPTSAAATTGAVLCFGLRFIAMRRGWQLPIARPPQKG